MALDRSGAQILAKTGLFPPILQQKWPPKMWTPKWVKHAFWVVHEAKSAVFLVIQPKITGLTAIWRCLYCEVIVWTKFRGFNRCYLG